MSFFVTSVSLARGANLGCLAGADAHCQILAKAAVAGNKTWRASLSTQGLNAVNGRDRIGTGACYSSRGAMIARDIAHLHGDILEVARHLAHGVIHRGPWLDGDQSRPPIEVRRRKPKPLAAGKL